MNNEQFGCHHENDHMDSRRSFLKKTTAITALSLAPPAILNAGNHHEAIASFLEKTPLQIEINGTNYKLLVDPGVSLLDLLREQIGLTGTKKGCDQGHCGACIVHVNGKRVNSCLTEAVENNGKKITTIEGLAKGDKLHPMQEAFIKHDAFQCGYCTSGQIMSAIACIKEGQAGSPEDIREYMSDNICRCGAYPNIVAAITEVKNSGLPF
ncbi:MAG: 2Fe-2S iron-sulfur cluster binding domain-containing protein [Chitinophagaceae bacterium]|nr:2Fe-2S iron-sulfur cluster binding domain-containing protein [Chitinophagaceae bacterium]